MKDNLIVTRAYVKCLVNHFVRKYALDAQITVYKCTKEVKNLKGDIFSKGDLRSVRALAYSDKKVADKALSPKKWLQGDPKEGFGGDAFKEAEEEGLTTLVVCDTGSLDGSIGN